MCPNPAHLVWHAATITLPGESPVRIHRRYFGSIGHSAPTECDSIIAVFAAHLASETRSSCSRLPRLVAPLTRLRIGRLRFVLQSAHPAVVARCAYLLEPETSQLDLLTNLLIAPVGIHAVQRHRYPRIELLQQPVREYVLPRTGAVVGPHAKQSTPPLYVFVHSLGPRYHCMTTYPETRASSHFTAERCARSRRSYAADRNHHSASLR